MMDGHDDVRDGDDFCRRLVLLNLRIAVAICNMQLDAIFYHSARTQIKS